MDAAGKFLLIGGGGFLLYETGILSALTGGLIPAPKSSSTTASAAGSSSSSSSNGPVNPSAPPPINPAAPPPATPTWQLVLAKATTANPGNSPLMLTFDQWNYYYQQVTGVPGPAPDSLSAIGPVGSAGRGSLLQVSQWWAYMQQLVSGLSGLGIVVNRPVRSGFGRWGGGFGGFVPANSSYCGPTDPVSGMQPPVDKQYPTPGCSSGVGRLNWIY